MAITGNPGDLATGGFGTGVRGVAATPRDVANAVARGEAMAGARANEGGRDIGTGFRGPATTWGGAQSVVPGSALSLLGNQPVSPMAPYGNAFDFTPTELTSAIKSMNRAGLPGAGMFDLLGLQSALQRPENIAMSEVLGGPFASSQMSPSFSVPSGILGGALNAALPSAQGATVAQEQDMGPLSDAAISAALSYQNTPLENDIAYLASRVGPAASPEALALVDPTFVTELAREIRKAEEATGTTARINDLYRSPETQAEIRERALREGFMAAPAGASWHQAAVAADIARSPVLNYMRANVPASLNFPFGQEDLVHVQMSNPMMAQTGVTRSQRGAFSTTLADTGSLLGGGDMGQMTPTYAAAAPSPSPAPVRAVMPQTAAATPTLPPRTPTPTMMDRVAANLFGIPSYDTGPGILGGAAKAGEYGSQLLAGSQPQVVEAASAPEAPPIRRPTGQPVSLASLLLNQAASRNDDRRRRRRSTTTEQTMNDTIGGLLA